MSAPRDYVNGCDFCGHLNCKGCCDTCNDPNCYRTKGQCPDCDAEAVQGAKKTEQREVAKS